MNCYLIICPVAPSDHGGDAANVPKHGATDPATPRRAPADPGISASAQASFLVMIVENGSLMIMV